MSSPSTPTRMPSTFRPSPFKRPSSPLARSPSNARASTMTQSGSPLKQSTPLDADAQYIEHSMSARTNNSASDISWIKQANDHRSQRSTSPIPFKLPAVTDLSSPLASSLVSPPVPLPPPHSPVLTLPATPLPEYAPPVPAHTSHAVQAPATPSSDYMYSESYDHTPRSLRAVQTPQSVSTYTPPTRKPPTITASPLLPIPSYAATSRPNYRSASGTITPTDALSSVPPNYLHTMRESFSVLDRSNTGQVTRIELATTLAELGLDDSPAALRNYFPGDCDALNLSSYLNLLAHDLVRLSRQDELLAAFAAFDKDDSGQIDIAELKEALRTTTLPEGANQSSSLSSRDVDQIVEGFVGRRVLRKGQVASGLGGGNKDVFRYNDFVMNTWAAGSASTT